MNDFAREIREVEHEKEETERKKETIEGMKRRARNNTQTYATTNTETEDSAFSLAHQARMMLSKDEYKQLQTGNETTNDLFHFR